MKKTDKEADEYIKKRLDALIAINLIKIKEDVQMREQIRILNNVGLNYREIAKILGKSEGYVSSEITLLKRKGGPSKKETGGG